MKLKRLLKNFPELVVKGSKEIEITGISANSKSIAPGNLFIAKNGRNYRGSDFIPEAIQAGAIAVLTDIYDPFLNIVQMIDSKISSLEAQLVAEYYQFPSKELEVIGVTGTNGKTTCCYLTKYLLDRVSLTTGLIGTIEWIVGESHFPATHTTPDIVTTQKLLREMIGVGAKAAVMEVSSHALDQDRVQGIDFSRAVFTNFTQDHLDYHKTMEAYAAAKEKLFYSLSHTSLAIMNEDDPMTHEWMKRCPAKILTYGMSAKASLYAKDLILTDKGMQCTVHFEEKKIPFKSPLIGQFNLYNLLATIAVGLSFSIPLEQCLDILKHFKMVPGRLERVKNKLGLNIFIDFAHTEDALKNVLKTLTQIKQGRLITVFGCGGNRDALKRKKMGSTAETLSDIVLVTSDNPRFEDPYAIAEEILQGFLFPEKAILELDRRKAIERALELATPKDLILIAGKGHEKTQQIAHQVMDFDDCKVAEEICEALSTYPI